MKMICPVCKHEITEPETIEFLGTPIESMGFSTRVKRALYRGGIDTLELLLTKDEKDLMRLRNFGVVSLWEVNERLLPYRLPDV